MAAGLPDPEAFASKWADEWNSRDLDAILRHYSPDVVFSSPVAAQLLPDSGGTVRGIDALRDYWSKGLAAYPTLHFEVLEVFAGTDTLVIRYGTDHGDVRAEILTFADGVIVEGRGTYGYAFEG
jgi:ketosteroid isomerase-like protein